MRVLAIGNRYPPAATGGYERIWVGTMDALRRAGHEVEVLTTVGEAGSGPGVHRDLRWYWRDHQFPPMSARERLGLERHNAAVLRRHLATPPDVVSYWGLGGMSLSVLEHVRRAGVPAVGVVGDAWMIYGPEVDGWARAWSRRPRLAPLAERALGLPTRPAIGAGARWLFISRAVLDEARRRGHDLPRTGLAHPGVDPERFPEQPAPPWGWRLAVIGRVEPPKGVATAIEALAHLPDAALTIDGPGEKGHMAELRGLADRLGVAGRITWQLSRSEEIPGVYSAADAVLFPVTWPEPWGLVPLEAMSVGRPVVATGTGGSGEYLDDGVNALLFPPGDAAALAAAVIRLAGDETLRERVRAAGRATAARYSQAAFEATVVAALEDEAAVGRARSPRGWP